MSKRFFIAAVWIIILILSDIFILRGFFHLGYPMNYNFKGSAREPKPYIEFMREGISKATSFDKEDFFKDTPKEALKVVFFGGSTGEILSSELFEKKLTEYFGKPVRFLNLSCISANHRQHLHMIPEILPECRPDIVIFYGGYNETVQPAFYDPRPGYPYNFFYKGETSPFKKLLIEHSAVAGMLEYRFNFLTPLKKLREEYNPLSQEWNKLTANKYLETIYLSKEITEILHSDKYGNTRFIAFYQPYRISDVPEFSETNETIRKKIKDIEYIEDVNDAYAEYGDEVWDDICHVKKDSGANEYMIDLISKITAEKFKNSQKQNR